MFRNPDNKVIAGVCSGLGAYLNVDPIIIRILFIIMIFISYGVIAVIAYAVLWAVMPEASTVAQKLQMKGEIPNVENIRQAINEGELSQQDKNSNTLSVVLGFIVKIVAIGAIAFLVFTLFPLLLMMIVPLLLLFGIFDGNFITSNFNTPNNMIGTPFFTWDTYNISMIIGIILLIIIPAASLTHHLLVRNNKIKPMPNWLKWTLIIVWLLILVSGIYFVPSFF